VAGGIEMNWSEEQFADYQKKKGITHEPEKKAKYNNNRPIVDGIYFDSTLEAGKYSELKLSLKMGVIAGFCRQTEFILQEGFGSTKPIAYLADFVVFNLDGTAEIIDTKGFFTEIFKIRYKLFKAKFPKLELKIEGA
jgi:hypothetical protein